MVTNVQQLPIHKHKQFIFLGFLLVILNALDGIFTYIGLITEQIEEANPLLSGLDPIILLGLKLLCSAFLFYFLMNPKYIPFKKFFFPVLVIVNIVYLAILGIHIFWVSTVF
jgi:hypothetical protein